MVIGQRYAVRLYICNVTRPHTNMSRMNAPKYSEPVRPRAETLRYPTSLPFGEGVEIFSLYGCEKILPLSRLPGQVILGWLQSIRRWAGNLLALFRSRPARRRGCRPASQKCSVQVGREKCNQSGNRPSYIIDSSP